MTIGPIVKKWLKKVGAFFAGMVIFAVLIKMSGMIGEFSDFSICMVLLGIGACSIIFIGENNSKYKIAIFATIAAILIFSATVWPTAYKEYVVKRGDSQVVVKVNRFTNETLVFNPYSKSWSSEGSSTPSYTPSYASTYKSVPAGFQIDEPNNVTQQNDATAQAKWQQEQEDFFKIHPEYKSDTTLWASLNSAVIRIANLPENRTGAQILEEAHREIQADGGGKGYVTLSIGSSYKVEIPKKWKIHDESMNIALQSKTDNAFNYANIKQSPGQNRILVAANAYSSDNTSLASARLSERYTKSLSQSEMNQLTKADIQELGLAMQEEISKGLKSGFNIVKTKFIKADKQIINGKVCMVTELETELDGKILRQICDLYFLGDRNVKMSVAYDVTEAGSYRPVVNKIRNSLVIK